MINSLAPVRRANNLNNNFMIFQIHYKHNIWGNQVSAPKPN